MSLNSEFDQWFTAKFGKPTNPQQEFVMSCCHHAWMASRKSMREAEETKAVMLKAVDEWEARQ